MLNFLGAIASLLPGYMQGQQQAIKDNWQDLANFNNVQAGQLSNAFTEATWQPRLDMFGDRAMDSAMATINNGMNTAIKAAYFPGQYYQGNIWSMFAPTNAYQDNMMGIQARQMMQRLANNPSMFAQMLTQQQQPQGMNPTPTNITG